MIDPFRLSLALGPVAVYLFMLGGINMGRRPLLVSGARDLAAMGLAVSGLVIVGPAALFVPTGAMLAFGPYVWVLLTALGALFLVLVILTARPRLVIYNILPDQLRPVMAEVATQLDADSRWAGDSLAMPNLGVRLHMESTVSMRNVSLVASGLRQNYLGWRRLERALGAALVRLEVPRNPRGLSLVGAGALLGVALLVLIARDPHAAFQSLAAMLQLAP